MLHGDAAQTPHVRHGKRAAPFGQRHVRRVYGKHLWFEEQ
jgi:hypothetical protein